MWVLILSLFADARVEEEPGRTGRMFQQSVTLTATMWYEVMKAYFQRNK